MGEVEAWFNAIQAEDLARSLDLTIQQLCATLAEQDAKHRELIEAPITRAVA